MNLAVDIGNSWAKFAVMDQSKAVAILREKEPGTQFVEKILSDHPQIDAAIMTTCRSGKTEIEDLLRRRTKRFIVFDNSVPVPIRNLYGTPQTLGPDRLAAAVGANALYPGKNVLAVDFGTAITIDMVSDKGEFLGGNISPGAETRFRALHKFTGKLPLLTLRETDERLIGQDTHEAINNGVVNGIVYEIKGYIDDLNKKYNDLQVIFTGGESIFFAKRFKKPIFVNHDLVVYGLNRILEYNAK